MKLHLHNVGPIKDAHLDIRPLTIFVGPNNTGKTWAASALHLLLDPGLRQVVEGEAPPSWKKMLAAISPLWLERLHSAQPSLQGLTRVELTRDELAHCWPGPVKTSLDGRLLGEALGAGAASSPGRKLKAQLEFSPLVTLEGTVGSLMWGILEGEVYHQSRVPWAVSGTPGLPVIASHMVQRGVLLPAHAETLRRVLEMSLLPSRPVWHFPATRTALTQMVGQIGSELAQGLPSLSRHFLDWLRLIADSDSYGTLPGNIAAESSIKYSRELERLLESGVMKGRIKAQPEGLARILYYRGDAGEHLRLAGASSLVQSMASLDLYLRHRAKPGDTVIIDEPEMNLHPEAQLALVEVFGVMVNAGINVIFTTHTPYMVEHIDNIVRAAALPLEKRDRVASRFKLQTSSAFVPEDKVAAYLFHTDGRVTDLKEVENIEGRRNIFFNWRTFGASSDYINSLYGHIVDEQEGG